MNSGLFFIAWHNITLHSTRVAHDAVLCFFMVSNVSFLWRAMCVLCGGGVSRCLPATTRGVSHRGQQRPAVSRIVANHCHALYRIVVRYWAQYRHDVSQTTVIMCHCMTVVYDSCLRHYNQLNL